MRESLRSAGDPDYGFLERAQVGLPLGVSEDLPRTPAIFEKQTKWSLEDDPSVEWCLAKENYVSAAEHKEHLRKHLEAEVDEGLMSKVDEKVFEERYGRRRAVAALAVLVEDEVSGKKRIIHDGTHGIGVNNRIHCKDKVRMPGPREKRAVLEEMSAEKEVVMALVGDFEKAHRRFLYQESERGYLGCKVEEGDGSVYINHVGTFGIASTPYWWARISGALLRLTHYIVGPGFPVEMLLYVDDLEVIAPGIKGRIGAVLSFIVMSSMGAPFKWKKQRGGWVTEWIGINSDYRNFSLGLTEKRAAWLCEWMESVIRRKEITEAEFSAGLGRLSFAALALPWERPLLGPLFGWAAAVRGNKGLLRIPWVVLMVMKWIVEKMRSGLRMEKVRREDQRKTKRIRVWTDAKATEDQAWIGGWIEEDEDSKKCEWFSEEVVPWMAPWLKIKGRNPKRVIAALEMLATLVAVKIWIRKAGGDMNVRAEAFTDNRGNEFILQKGMTTKFPIALLVIEMSETLRSEEATAGLTWIRREDNQKADDLTNMEFKHFSEERRIRVTEEKCEWLVLKDLLPKSEELYREIQEFKDRKKLEKAAKTLLPKGKKRKYFGRWIS
eukprot:Skav201844  [mRNA]  locus=scaffold484:280511:282334:- [translate_table: standard]